MAEPHFAGDDDLPRTLRRERDARERDARERELRDREAQMAAYPAATPARLGTSDYAADVPPLYPQSGTVTRFEVPFMHLVWFFMKAVLAAIPALILLTAVLIASGKALQAFMPGLRIFEIVVRTPDASPARAADPAKAQPTPPTAKK